MNFDYFIKFIQKAYEKQEEENIEEIYYKHNGFIDGKQYEYKDFKQTLIEITNRNSKLGIKSNKDFNRLQRLAKL
ncbi:MAG: hypothetical protein FH761_16595 [Firmicutes bacterium]|nr:hypothetical protein [Bacillota bacterium]